MLDLPFLPILVFLVGLVASFIGTIGTGAGLVSLPFFLLLGFPPQIAIATNNLGLLGFEIGPLKTYHQNNKIIWRYIIPFTTIAIIGSALGAKLLLNINSDLLSRFIGVMLLSILVFMFVKKDLGVKKKVADNPSIVLGYFFKFLAAVWAGFFGAGTGIIESFIRLNFFGLTIIESKATGKIPSIIASMIALVIFAFAGVIDYFNGIILLVGMFVGSYIGGHLIIEKGDRWAKNVVMGVILVSAVRLLLF